jgi:precorrin-8X/cobalt-precorrin-8 methylmutase
MQTKKGQSIEDASMQMIEDEIGSHNFSEKEWPIVRRIIHSTADFDFADKNKLIFHKDAIESGMNALKNGCSIVVDVNGVIGGMNKQNPKDYGNNIVCNISKPEIMELAKKEGKTRSQVSMRAAISDIDGGVVAIGNAPTDSSVLQNLKKNCQNWKELHLSPILVEREEVLLYLQQ